jgi:hypothetical protein
MGINRAHPHRSEPLTLPHYSSASPPQNGWTSLHLAAARGYLDQINKLLAMGADIDAKDQKVSPALHTSISYSATLQPASRHSAACGKTRDRRQAATLLPCCRPHNTRPAASARAAAAPPRLAWLPEP